MQIEHVCGIEQIDQAIAWLADVEKSGSPPQFEVFAPILIIPNVFEAELRESLIEQHRKEARDIAGYMKRSGGQTIRVVNENHKIRRDHVIDDQPILDRLSSRIRTRVISEIKKIHQFEATKIERHLVGCYTAEDGGHFGAHRDNTTLATAHRKFALSVNLNDDFDGGEISFPEYGTRSYRAPAGGAVVFSCSLLHAVSRVKRGARYAYLPFLYDDEGARVRAANASSYAGASFQSVGQEAQTG
jgi:predicted 2-oxoglutarate/Fe(II)-dependent dioxygenase YbiX